MIAPHLHADDLIAYWLEHGFLSADVNGNAAPGYSSGEARAAVERIAEETLPKGFAFEWTELR